MLIKLFTIALPVFFTIDMIWLGIVAKNFYRAQIGTLNDVADVAWSMGFMLLAWTSYLLYSDSGRGNNL